MNGAQGQQEKEVIAYFSMEVGISHTMPTYSGGLGVLAGDTLKSFADMELPVVGITMLNEKGYFQQRLEPDGTQVEEPVTWNPHEKLVQLPHIVTVTIADRKVKIKAWKQLIYGTNGNTIPLYFLDTNIEGNSDYDRSLTSFLYGGDREYRLSQEIVLGIGGMKMLDLLGYQRVKKYHMNEGHAALLTIELLRKFDQDGLGREEHLEEARRRCVFTTHTPVAAGHDQFEPELFRRLLNGYVPENVLQHIIFNGKVNMTLLGLVLAGHVNGVAKRHGEVTKEMFPDYKIDYITNGIHPITWASEHMKNLLDRHVPGWRNDPYTLRNALSIPSEEVWNAHEQAKKELIDEVNKRTSIGFDHRRFTLGFARRFTAYKRPSLLLYDVDRLKAIANVVGDIQVIFAGKAHKNDQQGKDLIKYVVQVAQRVNAENGRLKIVFLEHYDMLLSKMMVSGCDVWLNNPQRPFEASGTSGMKAALNGTPHISTLDGWWIEGHIEGVTGWRIGPNPKERGFYDDYSPDDEADDLYRKLQENIIPLFYSNRHEWVRIMKHCIAINASFFNTYRMVQQYIACTYRD